MDEFCYYCETRQNVSWAPIWLIWLCPDCRERRTQAELRYNKLTADEMTKYMARPKISFSAAPGLTASNAAAVTSSSDREEDNERA